MTRRYGILTSRLVLLAALFALLFGASGAQAGHIGPVEQDGVNAVDTWSALGDRVWNDADGQGDQDGSETGINGVVVRLYNGACGPSGSPIAAAVTSGNGNYLFTYLADGSQVRYDRTYCVAVDASTLPSGFASTTGGHNRTVSPWGSSNAKLDVDFGYKRTSSLGILKTVNPTGNVSTGQVLNYQVVVSNPSAINQTGIDVTDSLPAGVSYVASSTSVVGPTATSKTVKDTFASQSYSRQDGPDNWSTNWVEDDPSGSSASSGRIYITGGQLRLTDYADSGTEPSIYRQVDLSGYSNATLSFDWSVPSTIDTGDGMLVEISNNGGSSYSVLEIFTGYNSATGGPRSYNMDGFISSNTRIRFRVILNTGVSDEYFAVDNVQITANGVSSASTTKDNNTGNATPDLANGTPPNLVAPGDGYALKPGQTLTINFQATVTAGAGTLINTAFAKSTETPNPVQSSVSNSVAASCPNNLLLNPSFETVTGAKNSINDNIPANWTKSSAGETGVTTGFSPPDGVYVGYVWTKPSGSPATMHQVVSALPNNSYQMTFYSGTHNPSVNPTIAIRFYNSSNVEVGTPAVHTITKDIDGSTLGGPYTLNGTAPATAATLRVIFTDPSSSGSGAGAKGDALCLTTTTPPNSGQIGDRVWYDLDSQGDQDGSEVGINGVTVRLYNGACGPSGSAIQTKVTSGNGNYLFSSLPAGTYCVAADTSTLPAPGYIQTNSGTVSNPKSVTIGSGGSNLDIDFGYVANQCLPTIDFETDALGNALTKGQTVSNQWAGWGITVSATAASPGTGPAMIFDSAAPTGGDTDLGTPNQSFSGPGVGAGGAAGMPGVNSAALGKILIISEDGSSSNPDDNGNGGVIKFTFSQGLRVDQVQILDIDNDEAGGTVKAYNATSGGTLLATGDMLGLGDNSFQIVPLNATGVRRLEITFPSSGAVPAITFCGTPPTLYTLGDRIWHDTNENGEQDTGELGIANVKMELLIGSTLAEATMTDANGIYTFTNLPAGTYNVQVAATNFNGSQPLDGYVYSPKDQGGDDTRDSDFDPVSGSVSVNLTANNSTIDGGFFQNINLCYAVADGTSSKGDGSQKDTLAFLNRLTGATAAVGSGIGNTNRYNIEAIAFQPGGSVLYAADAGQLGTLNLTTGAFTASTNSFGSGSGSAGSITFSDVDGLTFDPTTGFLYGSHRRSGPDVLFRINPATGQRVNDAFGADEYVVVAPIAGLEDVDDIAVDPVTGVMYAILNNGGSSESRLVTVNKSTGATTSVGSVKIGGGHIQDIEGLAFFNDGKLYGSSGKDGPTTNALYQIDTTTAVATFIGAFTEPLRDLEALECLSAPAAIVVEKSTNGEDADDLPGPSVIAGSTVTWTYFVVNTGGVTLNNVVLTDDKEGTISCPQNSLVSGASMSCVKTGVAGTGQYANLATVTGVRVDNSQTVQDTDPSHYNGIGSNPDYIITKVNNTDPLLHGVRKGETISFTVRITNTGDVPIVILPLRDTYVDGILTYIGATPVHSAAAPGQVDWDDLTSGSPTGFGVALAVGQSFAVIVEFVGTADTTNLPNQVTINTATVRNAFYDPDGPGGVPPQSIPDKSATAPAKITAPTAVEVVNSVLSYYGESAEVRWQTVNESNITGFHLHRSMDGGAMEPISQWLSAQLPGQADGAAYSFTDNGVAAGHSYHYELEVVAANGSSERIPLGILVTGPRIFLPSINR